MDTLPQIARWLIAVLLLCSSPVLAQPTQQDFERARDDALSMMLPEGTHASYIEMTYPAMTAAEAQELLDRIGDDQAHPRWGEARQALWLDGQPLRSEFNIWYIDDTRYRVNEDIPQWEESPTVDAVVNGYEGWTCGANGVLTALDLRNTPPMRDSRSYKDRIDQFVRYFVHAGVGLYPHYALDSFRADGDSWSATLRDGKTGATAELSGRYIADAEQFLVDRAESQPSDDSDIPKATIEVSDYRFDQYLQYHLPNKVVLRSSEGQIQREYQRKFAKPFDRASFQELARIPIAGHTDPLRPDVQLRRIDDFRTSLAIRTEIDPETGSSATKPIADDREIPERFKWSSMGWVLAGVCLAALIVVRVRSGSS